MKKKQLKDYINQYRATVRPSPDEALTKRSREGEAPAATPVIRKPLYLSLRFWSIAASVLIVAVSLTVGIVLGTRKTDDVTPNTTIASQDEGDTATQNGADQEDEKQGGSVNVNDEQKENAQEDVVIDKDTTPSENSDEIDQKGGEQEVIIDGDDPTTSKNYYADDDDVAYDIAESIEAVNTANELHILVPIIDPVDAQYRTIRLLSDDLLIGVEAELSLYTEKYFSLMMYAYVDQYVVGESWEEGFDNQQTINGIDVEYRVDVQEDYAYYIKFEYEQYLYHVIVTVYEETPVQEILTECLGL